MNVTVIQEELRQRDLTVQELSRRWMRLETISVVEEVRLYTPERYPDRDTLDAMIGNSGALFGVWIEGDLIEERLFQTHPRLKYIATLGHGWEPFDAAMTRRYGVTITNTVYGAQTIAEYAFALLLECCHHVALHDRRVRATDWSKPENREKFCYAQTPQIELYGKTLGIVGLGVIGLAVARMGLGFGMRVLAYSRRKKEGPAYAHIEQVDTLAALLAESDVVSLHVPHTPETERLIDAGAIAGMKDGAILLNTARGALVDEDALARALRAGKLAGAGLDVLTEEPPSHGSPLLTAPNCVITGHIAWLTRDSRLRAVDMAIEQFRAYLEGKRVSVINQ